MGKAAKALKAFIENIPDSKLENLPTSSGTIYSDTDFRLDMQGMTSGKPQKHNIQVQINNQTTISTLKKAAPQTVSTYIASSSDNAAKVRQGLLDGMKL